MQKRRIIFLHLLAAVVVLMGGCLPAPSQDWTEDSAEATAAKIQEQLDQLNVAALQCVTQQDTEIDRNNVLEVEVGVLREEIRIHAPKYHLPSQKNMEGDIETEIEHLPPAMHADLNVVSPATK